jgi:putative hydroxymethylpyrimidine transport system substrate-binding protein
MEMCRWIVVGILLVLPLGGCGDTTDAVQSDPAAGQAGPPPLPSEIRVTLDSYMGPENVGLLMAESRGYFDDAGLNVWLGVPVSPVSPVAYVAKRIDELGVAQMPQVLAAQQRGVPVEAVGSVIPKPTAALIWLRGSGISAIADLKGKTIAVPGIPSQKDLLEAVLARAGLTLGEVNVETVEYKLASALLGGRADAIFGGSWNLEGAALKARGAQPVIKSVRDLGVPAYDELVVVARSDRVAADPQMIRAFMAAVERGTAAAVRDPQAAARVIAEGLEPNPSISREEAEAQLKATLPLLSETGHLDPERTAEFTDWMRAQGFDR